MEVERRNARTEHHDKSTADPRLGASAFGLAGPARLGVRNLQTLAQIGE
jgi:hypothetical protein